MFAGDLKSVRLQDCYTNAYLIFSFIPAMKIMQTLRVQLTSVKTYCYLFSGFHLYNRQPNQNNNLYSSG